MFVNMSQKSVILKRHKGFTLAEVLITLGVIGVIAAILIKTVLQEYDKQVYVALLQKNYATINTAIKNYLSDSDAPGNLKNTDIFSGNGASASLNVGIALSPYFRKIKDCGVTSGGKCFASSTRILNGTAYSTIDADASSYKFITADGSSIYINDNDAGNCSLNYGLGALREVCGNLYVDVNGLKGPNIFGRDTFWFDITNSGILIPRGAHSYNYFGTAYHWDGSDTMINCTSTANIEGRGCAGRIMEKGWKMDY